MSELYDELLNLAGRVEAEAEVAARPGQLDRLESVANRLRALAGTLHDDRARDEQPAPTAREIPAAFDVVWRHLGDLKRMRAADLVTKVVTYRQERDAARAELEQVRTELGADAGQDTLHELRYQLSLVRHWHDKYEELRARDEAAKAVVQWWAVASDPERSGEMRWDIPQEGREALDALARVHGDGAK